MSTSSGFDPIAPHSPALPVSGEGVSQMPVPQWPAPQVPNVPAPVQGLPIIATDYFRFWRVPGFAPWRPIVLALVAGVGFLVVSVIVLIPALIFDWLRGRGIFDQAGDSAGQGFIVTPAIFTANNVGLALMIVVSMLGSWLFIKQRPRWLSSVEGGLRWRWLWRCVAILAPLWIVYTALEGWLISGFLDLKVGPDTPMMIVAIVLTTPFQAAGEEYLFRGLGNRVISSLFPATRVLWGAIIAGAITSILFMLAHGAGDMWLNVFYFTFGALSSYLVWRTGGLEASIAMHVINNLLAEIYLPFTDISGMFDRGAGTAGPGVLIGTAVAAIGVALVEWQTRRVPVARLAAPGVR